MDTFFAAACRVVWQQWALTTGEGCYHSIAMVGDEVKKMSEALRPDVEVQSDIACVFYAQACGVWVYKAKHHSAAAKVVTTIRERVYEDFKEIANLVIVDATTIAVALERDGKAASPTLGVPELRDISLRFECVTIAAERFEQFVFDEKADKTMLNEYSHLVQLTCVTAGLAMHMSLADRKWATKVCPNVYGWHKKCRTLVARTEETKLKGAPAQNMQRLKDTSVGPFPLISALLDGFSTRNTYPESEVLRARIVQAATGKAAMQALQNSKEGKRCVIYHHFKDSVYDNLYTQAVARRDEEVEPQAEATPLERRAGVFRRNNNK
eukprot:g3280.t1